ncbi:zona pellucida sperm-binding protein 3-like [Hemiscyllium ocellatum]|uniref:zona pellucida sperm-binding protein 3-like n=1 Tax=Hemiscyllium ocellatum TaxID=170820 RepID=UPI00296601A3|nr:zona pellucida sperm-binding protein 3-like [Hemiscyllium ocellatum]
MVQCGEHNLLVRAQLDLFGTRHLIKAADLTLGTAGCQPTRVYPENQTVLFDYGLHECDDWLTERTSTLYYLGDLIHIEASVSMANHVSLKLYIDRCVATLSPDKDSTLRYSIVDYNGCLLDSKAEDSFSTFVLPRDGRKPDKLQFDLDAFRFYGDE